jgi:microcystin-dependent protein
MDAFIGEIRPFVFLNIDTTAATPPVNWLACNGQTLSVSISLYQRLFSVIGNSFGGTYPNFCLPNLNGMVPAGGATLNTMGDTVGQSFVTLTEDNMPQHNHAITAQQVKAAQQVGAPAQGQGWLGLGNYQASNVGVQIYDAAPAQTTALSPQSLGSAYSETVAAHENRMPFIVMPYFICYWGSYPVPEGQQEPEFPAG